MKRSWITLRPLALKYLRPARFCLYPMWTTTFHNNNMSIKQFCRGQNPQPLLSGSRSWTTGGLKPITHNAFLCAASESKVKRDYDLCLFSHAFLFLLIYLCFGRRIDLTCISSYSSLVLSDVRLHREHDLRPEVLFSAGWLISIKARRSLLFFHVSIFCLISRKALLSSLMPAPL